MTDTITHGPTGFVRYAVYWVPDGPLADFGAAWLGWDIAAGRAMPHPAIAGLPAPAEALTATPRRYGLHATLKPPFRLAEGQTEAALCRALGDLAAATPSERAERLELSSLGRFVALVPPPGSFAALAAAMVRGLDALRAPMTDAERARRRPEALTPRQRNLLDQWGYPHVMEGFRFHVTLTGDLSSADAGAVRAALEGIVAPLLPQPFIVDQVALAGEDAEGHFHLIERFGLGASRRD